MRKQKYFLAALLLTATTALTGCKSSGGNQNNALLSTEEGMDFYAQDYVKLGDYKGLEVQYPIPSEVTQDDIDSYIQDQISYYTEYTDVDRAAKIGDSVCINFTGTIDGEEFDGGSAEDYILTLGSGEFLEDFENALVGKKTGETTTFSITFPDDYDEDGTLSGKEAEFTVTINYVSEVTVPEYNDQFVAEISDYKTTAEYEAYVKELLAQNYENSSKDMAGEDALALAMENATVDGYPEELFNSFYEQTLADYQMYADFMGMDFEDFLTEYMSEDDIKEVALDSVNEFLIVQAIADKEGIKLTKENFEEEAKQLATEYEYDSVESMQEDFGTSYLYTTLLREKVKDFLYNSAKVTEVSEEEYYQDMEDEEYYYEDTEAVG